MSIVLAEVELAPLNRTILFNDFHYNNESRVIDLSKRNIQSIHPDTFVGLVNLEILYLQENNIFMIE